MAIDYSANDWYPLSVAIHEPQPAERIPSAFADADMQTKLLSGNARRFLNLAEELS